MVILVTFLISDILICSQNRLIDWNRCWASAGPQEWTTIRESETTFKLLLNQTTKHSSKIYTNKETKK